MTTGESSGHGSLRSERQRASRRAPALLFVLYAVLLAVILFSPSSRTQSSLVVDVVRVLLKLGASPALVTDTRAEIVLNAVIVAPLTFLGSFVIRRLRWQDWTAYAFLGATTVELVQGLLLPARQASFSDIVANTAGALLGALVARLLRH